MGDEAGGGAGQHDAHHQPAHDIAHHPAAHGFRRQMRGVGHQHLHGHRADADDDGGGQERGRRGGKGSGGERHCANTDDGHNQAPVFEQVAQRHHQQQPGAIAKLCHGDDQAGSGGAQAERRADRPRQWLAVVDVGDDQATGGGEQQSQPSRRLRLRFGARHCVAGQTVHFRLR
jgi:hypothetical protein